MHTLNDTVQYIAISPRMLRPDTRGRFDLYLRHDGQFVLFNSQDMVITKAKIADLAENHETSLYIAGGSAKHFKQYVREHIADILIDDTVPMQERARVWAGTASTMGREMFEENLPGPTFAIRCERFAKLIEETAGFLQCPDSLKHLSSFISSGYESYHHGLSTMIYAVSLMQEFQDDDYEILACGMGAMLHDIGKLALPDDLLRKDPATLTADEKAMVAVHPMVSMRTCSHFNLPPAATNAILFHHERDDGRGYPTRATGDQLTIHTKIVSLCNIYDNLTRTQPYRKALQPFEALKTISQDDGLVDKDVLSAFIKLMGKAKIV